MPNNQSNERLDSIQCIDGFSSYRQCLSSCHSRLSSHRRCHSLHGQYLFAHFLLHVMRLLGKDETGQQSRRHRQWQFTLSSLSSLSCGDSRLALFKQSSLPDGGNPYHRADPTEKNFEKANHAPHHKCRYHWPSGLHKASGLPSRRPKIVRVPHTI